ncbi:hypothetical protein GGS20DRAFT_278236 [Poronia punctata]|nr:hypothetical protein GGS20DRAFT_278236 [Poronia punctata]
MGQIAFLDIPDNVRRDIYLYAGVLRRSHITLRPRLSVDAVHFHGYQPDFRTTFSLLQASKAIHDEVKALVFSENLIIAPYDNIDDALDILSSLPTSICAKLTKLCVHLHVEVPINPPRSLRRKPRVPLRYPLFYTLERDFFEYTQIRTSHVVSKGLPKPSRPRMALWQAVARRLLSHSAPGGLEINLVCHSADQTTVSALLRPLNEYPGVLKDFHLDLGRHGDTSRSPLSSPVLAKAKLPVKYRGLLQPAKPFRFLDLPLEIQEQVLLNTDLITPYKEIYWNRRVGYQSRFNPWDREGDCHLPLEPDACGFRICTIANCHDADCLPCCTHRCGRIPSCSLCWRPPTSLMLVCRAMYDEAVRVLWRYNRVIIHPWQWASRPGPVEPEMYKDSANVLWRDHTAYPQPDFKPPGFDYEFEYDRGRNGTIDSVVSFIHARPHILRRLRNLELVFGRSYMPSHPYASLDEWPGAIGRLGKHANVQELTIRVHFSVLLTCNHRMEEDAIRPISNADLTAELRSEAHILKPFRALGRMKRFSVCADLDPLSEVPGRNWLSEETQYKIWEEDVKRAEIMLGRIVMGEEYQSDGPGEYEPSRWITYM